MKSFKRNSIFISAVISVAITTVLIIHRAHADADDKPATQPAGEKESSSGTAAVTTVPLREGEIAQTITAYGSVTTQPGSVAISSVPYECRVNKIQIAPGQSVDRGTALIDVEPSPAAKLALAEAQNNLELATKDLEQTQQRFDMKLGTNSDLLQSRQALKLSQLRLDSLKQQGATEDHRTVNANFSGLVARVNVQQGQIIPAGNPLVETVAQDQVEVRLGIEPSQIPNLKLDETVRLFAAGNNDPIAGKIRLITQRVNPDTRLVDIFVTPEKRDPLMLESFVRAEIVSETKAALIAPHDAVLPDDEGLLLFTIKDGKAVKHVVTTGASNINETAVVSDELHPGEPVVIQGNLELESGMPVSVENQKEDAR